MKPVVGISSCLLGNKVRYDGAHKKQDWLVEEFGPLVEWYIVCPEMAMGLGAPREPMHLKRNVSNGKVHLLGNLSNVDLTLAAEATAKGLATSLPSSINGFILKSRSPSCGAERVKVYRPNSTPKKEGVGFFAKALMANRPDLPLIEESHLNKAHFKEHFVTRVFAHYAINNLPKKLSALQAFHQSYKDILMAHDEGAFRRLGRVAANSKKLKQRDVFDQYRKLFLKALSHPTTVKSSTNSIALGIKNNLAHGPW